MPPRKLLTAALLAAGSIAGPLLLRRRTARRREHVDLYFADGSMVSLPEDAPATGRLLPIAREALRAARG